MPKLASGTTLTFIMKGIYPSMQGKKNVLQQINIMIQWNNFVTLQQIDFIMQQNDFVAKRPDTKIIAIQPHTSPMHAAMSYHFTQVPWIESKHDWMNVWDLAEILPN